MKAGALKNCKKPKGNIMKLRTNRRNRPGKKVTSLDTPGI